MSREDAEAEGIEPGQRGPIGQEERDTDTQEDTDLEPEAGKRKTVDVAAARDTEKETLAALPTFREKYEAYESAAEVRSALEQIVDEAAVPEIRTTLIRIDKEKTDIHFALGTKRMQYEDLKSRQRLAKADKARLAKLEAEVKESEQRLAKLRVEQEAERKRQATSMAKLREDALAVVQVPEEQRAKVSIRPTVDIDETLAKSISEAEEFFSRVTQRRQFSSGEEYQLTADLTTDSPHYNPGKRLVSFNRGDSPRVIVHETGHGLDEEGGNLAASIAFRESRTRGATLRPMRDYGAHYPEWQRTYGPDDLANTFKKVLGVSDEEAESMAAYATNYYSYSGREYATEILSKGLELYFHDPATFAKVDPEWFTLVHGALRGVW